MRREREFFYGCRPGTGVVASQTPR